MGTGASQAYARLRWCGSQRRAFQDPAPILQFPEQLVRAFAGEPHHLFKPGDPALLTSRGQGQQHGRCRFWTADGQRSNGQPRPSRRKRSVDRRLWRSEHDGPERMRFGKESGERLAAAGRAIVCAMSSLTSLPWRVRIAGAESVIAGICSEPLARAA